MDVLNAQGLKDLGLKGFFPRFCEKFLIFKTGYIKYDTVPTGWWEGEKFPEIQSFPLVLRS